MPIYVKDAADGLWKQANSPTSKLLFVREANVWKSVANVWLRQADAWVATDYVGVPNAPTSLAVTSSLTNYTTLSMSWTAPVGGAPVDHYRFVFYTQDGSFWTDAIIAAGTTAVTGWPVGPDTYYQMEVMAVSASGVESAPSNRVRYLTGHAQQTRDDPVYGWGTPFQVSPNIDYASSTGVFGAVTYHAAYAGDNNVGTAWISGARASATYFEALRISVPGGGFRRIYSVVVSQNLATRTWLGMAQDGTWYWPGGGDYPTSNTNFWNGATAKAYFQHPYLHWTPDNWPAGVNFEFVIDPVYVFTADRGTFDVACDLLKTVGGGLRGGYNEIVVKLQDWTIVSYNTVVTVTQKNNSYW